MTPSAAGVRATAPDMAPATARPTIVPIPGHEVYGFVPYWEMDESIVDHVAATDLTTLGVFSVTHRRNGALDKSQNGYKKIVGDLGARLIRAAQDRGTQVELVYTSFGPGKNGQFYSEPAAQARWIEVLVDLVDELGLDGVNVDVEGLPIEHVLDFGGFVARLREALRARMPDSEVSVATQANELGAAMAAAAAGNGADRIFLMGYDYHTASSEPGASAPIDRLDGEPRDLVWSLDLYAALGVPVERTILGLPLYGVTWPVIGPGVGSPSIGSGDSWVPRRNLAVFADPSFEPTLEPVESVEFYAVPMPAVASASPGRGASPAASGAASPEPSGWNAVYYDSPRSLAPKLALADDRGLAGAGFWAIGYERGLPGYRELIAKFRAGDLKAP
ncbi:MAG TPA: glycosyl hydrolase family 18 protein [Methylomirabilota bacterium]|nr:glycosyl hydrolase family 18 protein [Methylomirabilota bacterium]